MSHPTSSNICLEVYEHNIVSIRECWIQNNLKKVWRIELILMKKEKLYVILEHL